MELPDVAAGLNVVVTSRNPAGTGSYYWEGIRMARASETNLDNPRDVSAGSGSDPRPADKKGVWGLSRRDKGELIVSPDFLAVVSVSETQPGEHESSAGNRASSFKLQD